MNISREWFHVGKSREKLLTPQKRLSIVKNIKMRSLNIAIEQNVLILAVKKAH